MLGYPTASSKRRFIVFASGTYTIGRVAEMLGEDEDWLHDLSIDMDIEDGRITVWDTGDETITAFTDLGVENLTDLVTLYEANPAPQLRSSKPE